MKRENKRNKKIHILKYPRNKQTNKQTNVQFPTQRNTENVLDRPAFYIPSVPFKHAALSTVIFGLTLLFAQVAIHNINPAETLNNIDSADIGLYSHARWLGEGGI